MPERIDAKTYLISLLADPIRHSLSPTMHNEAFAKLGLPYAYLVFDVNQTNLAGAVQAIRDLGIRGSNISMPNKTAVLPLLDELTPAARLVGAVNTVVNQDGHLTGHITDGEGMVEALAREGVGIKDKTLTITGAGGAGTAIAIQVALDGAKEIKILNRQDSFFENGLATVDKINQQTACQATLTPLEQAGALKEAIAASDIFIEATSLGMGDLIDQKISDDATIFRPDLVVADVVYKPQETAFLRFARENGMTQAYNGLGMMLYQGAAAFKLFTGHDMPVDYIRDLLFVEENI
ncbi:quinate/shikimate dehydrogenase [Aerococcus urinaehominis]|uniref:Shikimate dehydrogenase (NADP(+)) n=1 Tax=Aerococcus urinaehominis TaxID=128944 RepID=A0A0X8FLX1_9LACT|nr:shikimate dehydrogenase [Aerococcus urinaehominis]AMB99052.1 quinate/shikimate dehydrogenase [Aerococcus urinaehominis]SDM50348.1 shikimate dehydrogenase [Aerococcus urinaehominis]